MNPCDRSVRQMTPQAYDWHCRLLLAADAGEDRDAVARLLATAKEEASVAQYHAMTTALADDQRQRGRPVRLPGKLTPCVAAPAPTAEPLALSWERILDKAHERCMERGCPDFSEALEDTYLIERALVAKANRLRGAG